MYPPFTDYFKQFQNNQCVSNQPKRLNDQLFMANTRTTTVVCLLRPPFVPLNTADIYSLNSINSNPFHTNTIKNATANPCQK